MACEGENFKDATSFDMEAWFSAESSNSISSSILIGESGIPDSGSPLIAANAGQDVANTQNAFFDTLTMLVH